MLTTILSKIGLPILVTFVAKALGRINHPVARSASQALEEVEGALAGGFISAEQMEEANRHAEAMAQMKMQEYETSMAQVNESLRAEIQSEDKYIRRMRPTFGYLMAATWATQMFGLSYIIIFKTEMAAQVMQGMAALSTIWAVGLSVLGIYVYKRSEDKKYRPTGLRKMRLRSLQKTLQTKPQNPLKFHPHKKQAQHKATMLMNKERPT